MRCLVTGAAGFIGSTLSEALAENCEVVGLDNFSDYYSRKIKENNIKDFYKKSVRFIEADLNNLDFSKLGDGFDVVFHFAAQPGISSQVNFQKYLNNNVLATQNLINWAVTQKKLFLINISTSSVYGITAVGSEETPPQPASDYGVTKLMAEQMVLSKVRSKSLRGCSLRLFSVYGNRERPEKMLPQLILSILRGSEFKLFNGSISHVRSFTHVDDIVHGCLAVLNNLEKSNSQIFNLGSRENYLVEEIIKKTENILGVKTKIVSLPTRPGDQLETRANVDKASKILDYNPSVSLEEGLTREIDWLKSNISIYA